MALDSYVTLGRSGLRISRLCLGGLTFGKDSGYGVAPQVAEEFISRYIEMGGNYVDTSNLYSKGHSEKIIGDFFAKRNSLRHRTIIASKFSCNMYPGDPNGGGSGRRAVIAQCEESLRRLQTDHIDLYWMHFWDFFTPIEETMRALDDLVRTGKIRYIGFSNTPAWKTAQAQVLAHFRGMAPIIAMQLEYSLLARTIEGEHTAMAQELGIGIMPWGALKSGILSGAYMGAPGDAPASARQSVNDTLRNISEKEQAVLDTLKRVADEVDASMASVALAWVLAQPGISATLMGLERLEQFEDNVKALDIVLSPEQLGALTLASQPVLNFPHGFVKILGPSLAHSGTTVNGIPSRISPLGPQTDAERH